MLIALLYSLAGMESGCGDRSSPMVPTPSSPGQPVQAEPPSHGPEIVGQHHVSADAMYDGSVIRIVIMNATGSSIYVDTKMPTYTLRKGASTYLHSAAEAATSDEITEVQPGHQTIGHIIADAASLQKYNKDMGIVDSHLTFSYTTKDGSRMDITTMVMSDLR